MTSSREIVTARLQLAPVTMDDLDDMYALSSDPRVWRHFPTGRHVDRDQTARQIASMQDGWHRDGLGYWTARLRANGEFAGVGGVTVRSAIAWNIYYRMRPELQGNGYANEVVTAARDAAAMVDASLPVIAYLQSVNDASRRTAERAGLQLVWRGPDVGDPDPDVDRLVYADREVSPAVLAELVAHP